MLSLLAWLCIEIPLLAQCAECGSPRTYTSNATSLNDRTNGGLNASRWTGSGNFSAGQIAKFSAEDESYTWTASDFNLGGIILSNGADLTLNRGNNGNEPGFTISDGCIVVGSGSVLRIVYITELSNLRICVEDGGSIIFDQRNINGNVERNDFTFGNVIIDLQGPNAELEFGDADIIIESGGLVIDGWTGDESELCENSDPPIPGSSGNISWTSEIQLLSLCEILNGRVLPIELAYFQSKFQDENRSVLLEWATLTEKDTESFEIERSVDGVERWEKIKEINANGNSEGFQAYNFSDQYLPLSGSNVYYRIRIIARNGVHYISQLTRVPLPSLVQTGKLWHIYPNPSFGGDLRIQPHDSDFSDFEEVRVRIFGKYSQNQILTAQSLEELNTKLSLEIQEYSPGIILLEIQSKRGVEVIKLIRK